MRIVRNFLGICALLICQTHLLANDTVIHDGITFTKVNIPVYQADDDYTPHQVFNMPYADHLMDPDEVGRWNRISEKVEAYEIDLVFTLYPKNIKNWRTNYYDLMSRRLEQLFAVDSTLRNEDISWNMVLQTECKSEEEAKQYFHGFVVKFRPKKLKTIDEIKSPKELRALIRGTVTTKDSTVIKVLERNPQWKNMLVVTDWTGSMYNYGAQLVLWHKLRMSTLNSSVRHFVFFNDGNKRKDNSKIVGKTGGVYHARNNEVEELVRTMELVMKRGNGGDSPENDMEAILTGVQHLEGYEEVILIADNKSRVRDIGLLNRLDVPVRIIVCGVVNNQINTDYIKIAARTGGSLHTMDQDLFDLSHYPSAMKAAIQRGN